MRIRLLMTLTAALIPLAPIAAGAATTVLDGHTTEAYDVKLGLDEGGVPRSFKIDPTDLYCLRGALTVKKLTVRGFEFDSSTTLFREVSFKERYGKFRTRNTVRVEAIPREGGGWGGEYDRVTKVMRRGRSIDTCEHHTFYVATA